MPVIKIILWSEDWCGPCQKLKAWMDEKGLKYEVRDSDKLPGKEFAIPRVQVSIVPGTYLRIGKGLDGCKNEIEAALK